MFVCVDNHETRNLINTKCKEMSNVILISGGNEFHDGNAQLFVMRDGYRWTAAIDEWHPEIGDFEQDDEDPGCQDRYASTPQLVFANFFASAAMIAMFYHYNSYILPLISDDSDMEEEDWKESKAKMMGEMYFDLEMGTAQSYNRPSLHERGDAEDEDTDNVQAVAEAV